MLNELMTMEHWWNNMEDNWSTARKTCPSATLSTQTSLVKGQQITTSVIIWTVCDEDKIEDHNIYLCLVEYSAINETSGYGAQKFHEFFRQQHRWWWNTS